MKGRVTREQRAYLTYIRHNPGLTRADCIRGVDSDSQRQQGYSTLSIMLRKGFISLQGSGVHITEKGFQVCAGRYSL